MTMPDTGSSLHNASLDYYCTFGEVTAAAGPITFSVPDPVRFHFDFETGSTLNPDGTTTYTWDYSWFNQTTVEAGIKTALNTICGAIATLLGKSTAAVQAAVTVQRAWTVAPNVQGPNAGSGRTVLTSDMAYP